jgi:cell division protease FtsH
MQSEFCIQTTRRRRHCLVLHSSTRATPSLRDPDTVAIIEVSQPDLVEPVARLLRKHVLGPETPVQDGDGLDKQTTVAPTGTVLIFKRTDEAKPRKALAAGTEFAAAVQLRCSIIGIAADLRQLPRELVSLAEYRIVVPPLNAVAIAATIEAVTGKHPGAIDEHLVRQVTLEALSIAVRAGRYRCGPIDRSPPPID